MTKIIFPALVALLSFCTVFADDFSFGAISTEEKEMQQCAYDSTANAVVLREYGRARFSFDDQSGAINLIFTHHVRLKIFNKEGVKQANIVIPLYKDGDRIEYVQELKAVTLNPQTNGTKVETWLETKNTYKEEYSKYVTLTKFTMPNIQNGSIIEYSYQIISPRLYNFRNWEFQTDIPKIYSEYEAIIPGTYNYNVVMRGPFKLSDQKSALVREGFRLPGWPIDCSQLTYIMKNVPAFIEEDYMTAASNFKSAIYFELADVLLRNGSKRSFTKEWKNVDRELMLDRSLGGQAKQKDEFEKVMPEITQHVQGDLNKAKAIYSFIKKQIKWNKYYGIFSELGVRKALDQHTGNIADINLALIAALAAGGLDAEVVILSTRENGIVNKLNPVISEFNYLIAKLTVAGESYFLDASDPLLPFGMLPLRCINDQGRVLPIKQSSYWVDLMPKEKHHVQYTLIGELLTDGTLKGKLVTSSYGYAAYLKRKEIVDYPSVEEYFEKKKSETPGMQILHEEISGLDTIERSLQERCEVSINLFDSLQNHQLFFNPFFMNKTNKNPFNLNERTYPVDIGMLQEESLNLDVKLPDGYELVSKPKDMNLALMDKGGQFVNRTRLENGHLFCNQLFRLNKMIYGSEEYLSLKEFFSRIIQLQKTDVVLQEKTI
ncbi:hypothetical protein GCM10023231_05640 [Olivibacter ginsenosidimutans]|uniref:DUF3857 domain-containing protein n=1 Tax=Olivibacter ginsenosidimutans TaxID=1176537 RepID=A0ABP9AJB3_9SPHI